VSTETRGRVLVLGAYFTNRESWIVHLRSEFRRSRKWEVDQRWIALGESIPSELADVTAAASAGTPKFILINRLLALVNLAEYQHVIVSDDDISLPERFVDDYLGLVEQHDFSLAQPARTHDSYTDHHFVSQLLGIRARQTRFVEIGPLFSIRADALALLTPFDVESPMGWGYDFVWPVEMHRAGRKMGIIDSCPIAHTLRKPVANYSWHAAHEQMTALLAKHAHLEPLDAFQIVKSFA